MQPPSDAGSGRRIADLETPCLIVDRARMVDNIARLNGRLSGRGVDLRPHLKTVKSVDAARLVLARPDGPATVSTLKEAEVFGRAGITDLLYSLLIAPQKLGRVADLRRAGIDLKIVVDSIEAARMVAAHSSAVDDRIPTLIEIDVDGHRSGVALDGKDRLIAIGETLVSGAELRGVMTHAGGSYALSAPGDLERAAEAERAGAVRMAEVLRGAGLPCPVVSVGSTPTGFSAASYDGITELRAGVYMFFDLVQAGIGVCGIEDIALSVLATVVGHRADKGWAVIDAGWTALSGDRGTASQAVNQYFGLVCDADGRPYDDLVVLKASQEHGIVAVRPGAKRDLPDLPIGTRIRILPNHACATAAQHDSYHVVEGARVAEVWPRFGGWSASPPKADVANTRHCRSVAVLGADAVREAAGRKAAFDAVRDAFVALADNEAELFPAVTAMVRSPETSISIKSGVNRRDGLVGLKVGTYWPDNDTRHGLANHGSTTLLLDDETGAARAVINARELNGLRTAAANAVATDALAREDAGSLAVLGVGHQAGYEIRAVCDVRPIARIAIWGRSSEKAEAFAATLRDLPVDAVVVVSDVEEAIAGADIITTVTLARRPLFAASSVPDGVHISAMGADKEGKQELDPDLLADALLFADDPVQSARIGEFQHIVRSGRVSADDIVGVGDVLAGAHPGRTSPRQITVFDSSGVAIQDLNIAQFVLDDVLAQGRAAIVPF